MTNATTLSSFQASLNEQDDSETPAPSPLAALAERMVRERSDNPESGDPFDGMSLDVDPSDAFGLVEAQVRQWCEDNNRWATAIEIRHKTDRLMQEAQNARPGPVKAATYTVEAGVVTSFTPDAAPDAAPAELPGMPLAPEPINGLRVPRSTEFTADGWADSTALWQRAQTLIERHPDELEHLEGMSLGFLWKLKGGKSRGRPIYGQCVKAGGLLKHFATSTFIIWLAADHVLAARYGDRQIEALLFRQLLAAGVAEVNEDTGRGGGATLVPPDVQAYAAELRVYGLWQEQLKSAAQAFRQAPLFGISPEEMAYFDAAGDEMEADIASGAYVPDRHVGSTVADAPLVCSVCGAVVDLPDDQATDARENFRVVLCEACGEDGVIDEGEES